MLFQGLRGIDAVRVLFVTWDGPDLTYVESLFLPIFAALGAWGIRFDILQFRWGDEARARSIGQCCRQVGVGYEAVQISRWPRGIGPMLSAVAGARHVRRAVDLFGSDVVMPRSLMPALATIVAGVSKDRPVVFDADGLPADERVEFAGLSATGPTYRALRWTEARMVREATSILTRSDEAARVLRSRSGHRVPAERFHVVTNGRDQETFHPQDAAERLGVRSELGLDAGAPLIVYAGSIGPQYRLDLLGQFAAELRRLRPDVHLLILTGAVAAARSELIAKSPELASMMTVRSAKPHEVPRYLAAGDVGAAFRASTFSMRAVAPIKLAEYLLCGLPVVGTKDIGDTSYAQQEGVFFDDGAGLGAAAEWVDRLILPRREEFRQRARSVGVSRFSLERSVQDYRAALGKVGTRP
jgi:glycosyltransferase involved in cell wall biosynthesis